VRDDQASDVRLGYEIVLEPLDRTSVKLEDAVSDMEDHVNQART